MTQDERIASLESVVAKQSEQIKALLKMMDLTVDALENSNPADLSSSGQIRRELEKLELGY